MAREWSPLLRFSLPFLEHVERYREHGALPMTASGAAAIHEHLRRVLVEAALHRTVGD